MRCHGVGWDDPGTLTQLMSDSKFIILLVGFGVEAKCDKWEAFTVALRHDDEAHLGEGV